MKITLEGREIKPEDLKEGFYLYRFEGQLGNATPRRTRKQILEIISTAGRDVELTNANFPYAYIYKNLGEK